MAPPLGFMTRPVVGIYVMGLCEGLTQSLVEFTLLLYMNEATFTSATSTTFYIFMRALVFFVPVLLNVPLTTLASMVGVSSVLPVLYVLIALGNVLFLLSRWNMWLFVVGVTMYALFWTARILRISTITRLVPDHLTTRAIALHQFSIPVGMLVGPLVWLLVQTWRGSFIVFGDLPFDRFSVIYVICAAVNVAMSLVARLVLPRPPPPVSRRDAVAEQQQLQSRQQQQDDTVYNSASPASSSSSSSDLAKWFVRSRMSLYCALTFVVRGTSSIFQVTFQPVFINHFSSSDAAVGNVFFIISLLALIPPLIAAQLSSRFSDRHIMVFGLSLKLIGMSLYLPLFGAVTRAQFVVGFALTVKATMFFTTTMVSVMSKTLGDLYQHGFAGLLWTFSMLGPAVTQAGLSNVIVPLFGDWVFGVFEVPIVVVYAVVLSPVCWKWLDPEHCDNRKFSSLAS